LCKCLIIPVAKLVLSAVLFVITAWKIHWHLNSFRLLQISKKNSGKPKESYYFLSNQFWIVFPEKRQSIWKKPNFRQQLSYKLSMLVMSDNLNVHDISYQSFKPLLHSPISRNRFTSIHPPMNPPIQEYVFESQNWCF
jgi:hypothetical protein